MKLRHLKVVPEDVCTAIEALHDFVQKHATPGGNLIIAAGYIRAIPQSLEEYGIDGLKTQILYILSNVSAWRGPEPKRLKEILRAYAERPGVQ